MGDLIKEHNAVNVNTQCHDNRNLITQATSLQKEMLTYLFATLPNLAGIIFLILISKKKN